MKQTLGSWTNHIRRAIGPFKWITPPQTIINQGPAQSFILAQGEAFMASLFTKGKRVFLAVKKNKPREFPL